MNVFIIGINGRVAQRHHQAWTKLGAQVWGCGSDVDYRTVLDHDTHDIVDICTPIYLHSRMIKDCVERGFPVICEKPLCLTENEAKELIELEGKIGIIYQFRFNPKIVKLRQEVMEGKFGEVKMVTANYFRWRGNEYYQKWEHDKMKAGGGVLFNVCIHYVDLIQWLFGYPTSVSGYMTTSKAGLEVEDNVVMTMKLPNGAIASVNLSTHVNPPKHFEFSVYGTKGYKTIQLRQNEYHDRNFKAFIKGEDYVDPREAYKSFKIVHDFYHNANSQT